MEQVAAADDLAAAHIADIAALTPATALSPLPVLGVPGWCHENENFSFYDDSLVFRAPRSAQASQQGMATAQDPA
jgi:hypothetical protein